MILTLFILFFFLIFVGVPIAFALALSSTAVIYFFTDTPLLLVIQRMYSGLDVFVLMAIPLFLFAGNLMTEVKISEKLVALASIFLGRYRGGLSLVATSASAIFGAISGSANATTAAIGSVMIPTMARRGYDQADAAAVVAASGILGLIVPPSITMVLYGVVAGVSIGDLFLSGIVPAIIIAAGLMAVNYWVALRKGYKGDAPIGLHASIHIIRDSLVALLMPVIILGGIYSGAFTPTESAAVASLYGLIVGFAWYRNLSLRSVFAISKRTVEVTATILFLIAASNIFTYVLSAQSVPQKLAASLIEFSSNPYVIMVLILGMLLILGTFLDNVAAIILVTPTLMPVVTALEIDPIFFGVYMVIAVAVGQITPPVGLNLFIATNLTNRRFEDVVRSSTPYFILYGVLLVVFIAIPGALSVFG
ncbi:TRAP transporter large permease [Sulfitobacter sp. W027]|jgi:C4-dicarboxylate transporter, DctM subunit|uniref:TRAP transporter large permease n=1 Tax=Sulfitobacter sp. W027 TaxID=2867025 RepID=UPI0021A83C65|nr:TRAP transporter large permease [Sulfitobacter sp. W027]UWR32558.1 TRAP transporter large permease [Sulfitobacter sp. W027]